MLWERMKVCKMGQASPSKKKVTWKKYGETVSKSRMRMSVEENWMKRERATRGRKIVLCFKGDAGESHGVNAASRGGEKEERSHA